MVLEKIIRSARIINTNAGIYAGILCAGMSLAAAAYSDENDTALFAFAGTLTAIIAWGAVREHKEYKKVAEYCEKYGFDRWTMFYNKDKAEIYALSENKVAEFDLARKNYRV